MTNSPPLDPAFVQFMDEVDAAFDGSRLLDSAFDVYEALAKQDPVSTPLAHLGIIPELIEFRRDPMTTLIAAGLGWLIEHVPPLRQAFDHVTADREAVQNLADTWQRVATAAHAAAEDLLQSVKNDTAAWRGVAAEAYRCYALNLAGWAKTSAVSAEAIAKAIIVAGDIVLAVRAVLRDILARCVADVLSALARSSPLLATGPAGAVAVAGWLVQRAWSWAKKMVEWVSRAGEAMRRLRELLDRLVPALRALREIRLPNLFALPGPNKYSWDVPSGLVQLPSKGAVAYSLAIETGKKLNDPGVG